MQSGFLQADVENRGVVFDPRTKMLLLITMAVFVLGGAGGDSLNPYMPVFCAVPCILFLLAKKWKTVFRYAVLYSIAYVSFQYFGPRTTGIVNSLIGGCCGIFSRFLPSIMIGSYLIETTTVSEFNAAMYKMHVTEKITIPLSVMFRFFPTVVEEFASINAAMQMRDIRFGGKNAVKMLEYRMVPLMVCTAKIGEELNAAALTRGLGGEVRRTNICRIGLHIQDWLLILLCLIPFVIWIVRMFL